MKWYYNNVYFNDSYGKRLVAPDETISGYEEAIVPINKRHFISSGDRWSGINLNV